MKFKRYSDWIDENYPTADIAYRKCEDATEEMNLVFPELIRVKGHYHDLWGHKHPHWWLKDEHGHIIDPTYRQWGDGCNGYYEELTKEPKGKCLNCGELSYHTINFCCDDCGEEFKKHLEDAGEYKL